MQQVSDEILRKLATLYFKQKKEVLPAGGQIPPWVRNINSMEKIDVEYETRDAIRNCRELKKSVGVMEYEGEDGPHQEQTREDDGGAGRPLDLHELLPLRPLYPVWSGRLRGGV